MADFEKYAYEEVYRYYEFERTDGKDGLAESETISTQAVTCEDENGVDCTSTMISNASIVDGTMVKYLLKAGTAGQSYTVIVKVVTSNGQKLEGFAEIDVIAD
jgi:hypothetical protein